MINSEIRNWMLKPYVFIWTLIPVRGRFQFGLWPRRKPFHSEAREQHLFQYWSLITSALYFSIWSFFLLCSVEVHWISIWSSAWARFVPALCRRTLGYTLLCCSVRMTSVIVEVWLRLLCGIESVSVSCLLQYRQCTIDYVRRRQQRESKSAVLSSSLRPSLEMQRKKGLCKVSETRA